jgi:polar amino acid transport system permease protein
VGLSGGSRDIGPLGSADPGGPPFVRRTGDRRQLIRSIVIAALSSAIVFGLLGWLITNSPGWEGVKREFLDPEVFADALPDVIGAFRINIQLFLIAEVLILAFGLLLAVLRSLPGPALFPLRLLATVYIDVFRAVPGVVIIFALGFGAPALRIAGLPFEPFFWAIVTLTLVYSAYVSEVFRAGIDSIHPSQEAAARSLGLSRFQSLRYVVVPQAIRRVIPPLLNDFIGLQKDTALVGLLGLVEVARAAENYASETFNFTGYTMAALLFIAVTIPLARVTDYLIERDRRRMRASAG